MMWALHKCQSVEEGTLELRADDLKFTVALILSHFCYFKGTIMKSQLCDMVRDAR